MTTDEKLTSIINRLEQIEAKLRSGPPLSIPVQLLQDQATALRELRERGVLPEIQKSTNPPDSITREEIHQTMVDLTNRVRAAANRFGLYGTNASTRGEESTKGCPHCGDHYCSSQAPLMDSWAPCPHAPKEEPAPPDGET